MHCTHTHTNYKFRESPIQQLWTEKTIEHLRA